MSVPLVPIRRGPSLLTQLSMALIVVAGVLLAWLLLIVGPTTGHALAEFGSATLRESAATMREVSTSMTGQSSQVLIDLIAHNTTARERALADLPLETLGGDVAAIRAAVLREDAERSARQRRNVEVLAAEMQRRAERDMQRRLDELADVRAAREAGFVRDLNGGLLTLLAVTLMVLLLVLGLGLHRLVVRPAQRLRSATRRVADGEATVDLPPAPRGELGELTRDFAAMVGELDGSRRALQHLADNLEAEVARKSRALESSHRQLAQAERLAALGTLAGGVAHEFHNVIGGIRGCADELSADEPDADRRETLAVITRAAERGVGIVRQLQRFAQQPVERRGRVDPAAIVTDALRLCEPAARRQQVHVERDLAAGLAVDGDADGLHQVFVNLLVNALQALPQGGTLTVRVHAAVAPDERVVVQVSDTGTGIPPEALPHVFEPFFTTRRDAADPAQRGSGLGLSVSYGIVASHGGRIEVESQTGRGTTFRVLLPRSQG
ncbi:MAG: HAMP domain-containing protein [Planctomycetes bacterium]|nr:HAMP domain-containing protein [Planctomycetota bacterium]